MKKIIIILNALLLVVGSYGQTTKKKQITETEINPIPLIEPIIIVQDDGWELDVPKRTMQSRQITIEIIDTVSINTDIFYYSPRMKNKDYPYWQELGNQNNHLGTTYSDNKTEIFIPDTCEQGAKLLFHAVGYELFITDINSIQNENHISVHLTPKIYNSTVVIEKRKYQFNPRRTYLKPIIADEIEEQVQIFYGGCSPIYTKNRQMHADPMCAFACLGCYPKLWLVHIEDYSLEEIYRELKKGKKCSVLLFVSKPEKVDRVEIEEFSNRRKYNNVQQDMQKSKWRFNPIPNSSCQWRIHFVLR